MSAKTSVDPGELRAAAHAEDSIAQDMTDKNHKTISATKDAAASFNGWSLSQALEATADSWKPSLDGMRSRAETGAANLRTCADGHDWNDAMVSKDFETAGAQTQFAPQTMSASTGFGGPGAIGSEGRHAMPGAENLRDSLTPGPGSPGSVGSEGVTPTARPPFVDRENAPYPGPDPRAEWTADRMQSAKPMQTPTADSPFG